MGETAKPKGLAKIWREIKRVFRKLFRLNCESVLERASFLPRVEMLLDQNQGRLDFLDQTSSALVAQSSVVQDNMAYLFDKVEFLPVSLDGDADIHCLWGMWDFPAQLQVLRNATKKRKPLFLIEPGLLSSVDTWLRSWTDKKYWQGVSFVLDDKAAYFDATRRSRLEEMLNDENLIVNEQQKQRAKECINVVTSTYLSKYNHQPIFTPQIGRTNVSKVLVVDQSYGDMSAPRGLADDATFQKMLDSAISENPEADIIVKTHPDTLANPSVRSGYYVGVEAKKNLYTLTAPINSIALLKNIDKVYVCTSQLGFEALLCGKEVHAFGMPFYAGWGLTKDRLACSRRTHTRTLEEIFYITYIMYTRYVNPAAKSRCEIEEAMNYLLGLRAEYFREYGVFCEWDNVLNGNSSAKESHKKAA